VKRKHVSDIFVSADTIKIANEITLQKDNEYFLVIFHFFV
jgi:hypothetical protein